MSSNPKNEEVNGYQVALYENSRGIVHYLYQGEHSTHGTIYCWFKEKPNGKFSSYGVEYYPCTMPMEFEVIETENIKHPVLKKKLT